MSFPENLQYLRKKEHLTQEQLAERLEVSRQAVSKWESGQSYPEMDKLMQLCDLFRCGLDDLVKGDVTIPDKQDQAGYDRHMNQLSLMTATAVSMIITSIALFTIAEAMLGGIVHDEFLSIGVFIIVGIAVSMLIVNGINHDYFKKRYSVIQNFYTEDERFDFNRKFAIAIAGGVCLIFLGLCVSLAFEHVGDSFFMDELGGGILLLCVAAAVWLFIYFGMQQGKYDVEKYNQESTGERNRGLKLVGKISGVIMLLATAFFLYMGLVHDMFGIAWVVYPIGGILCAIASVIWGDQK